MSSPVPAPPLDVFDVFLQPGEFYFGDEKTRIRTVLGSCVAIVLWHPHRRIGGMCHFMLPTRSGADNMAPPDGRYADEAVQLFMRELRRTGTAPAHYHAKMFGGGSMFESSPNIGKAGTDVPARNVEVARELLTVHGFSVRCQDMGGAGHRNVVFDLWSGDVWLRRVPLRRAKTRAAPEKT